MQQTSLSKINSILFFAAIMVVILYFGKTVLMPVVFAIFLAMLMTNICSKLEEKGVARWLAVLICILILLLAFAMVLGLVVAEFVAISKDWPKLQEKLEQNMDQLQSYIQQQFGVSPEQQIGMAKKQLQNFSKSSGSFVKKLTSGFMSTLAGVALTLVYTFLFLYKRDKYERFLMKLYKGNEPGKFKENIQQSGKIARQYLTGRTISVVILTILYGTGFLIIGLKNAILLAAIASLLTFVPYIGPVVGGLFPLVMSLLTGGGAQQALGVAGILLFVQALDNYFIEPYVVGGEVNISAFFTIFIIVVGGVIWGVAGMVLFIPLLGIIKILCDNVDQLKPYGYLIGDEASSNKTSKIGERLKKIFTKT